MSINSRVFKSNARFSHTHTRTQDAIKFQRPLKRPNPTHFTNPIKSTEISREEIEFPDHKSDRNSQLIDLRGFRKSCARKHREGTNVRS